MSLHRFGPQSISGTNIFVADPLKLEAALGDISNIIPVHKFGRHPAAPNGSEEDVWFSTGTMTWLQAAVQMDILSTSALDDGALTTNLGCQEVTIDGLDGSFNRQIISYPTAGLANHTTADSWIRVNRAFGSLHGVYHASNIGNITIRVTGGGAMQATIEAGKGQTQKTQYCVPNGFNACLTRFSAEIDSSKTGILQMFRYENADDVTQPFTGVKRLMHYVPGLSGPTEELLDAYPFIPPKTDLWWTITAGAASTDVSADYDLFLKAV